MIALGSSSCTRAALLRTANIGFVQRAVEYDEEQIEAIEACDYVYQITKGKYEAYLKQYPFDMPFLTADTVVRAQNTLLQKADDEKTARQMLELQSGNCVEIITCMIYKSFDLEMTDISVTKYQFSKFKSSDLNAYLKSGEWRGKAGAVMVEGFCKPYIKSVFGYESTAMGLCVEKLKLFLERR